MLTVVGMGPASLALMTPMALEAVSHADVLVGGKRHLAQFPDFAGELHALDADIPGLMRWIAAQQNRRVVVLASGDPLFLWHWQTAGGGVWHRKGAHHSRH